MFVPIKNVHLVGITFFYADIKMNGMDIFEMSKIHSFQIIMVLLITKISPLWRYKPFSWLVVIKYSKVENVNCFDMLVML